MQNNSRLNRAHIFKIQIEVAPGKQFGTAKQEMTLNWGILGASKIARDFILALKTLPPGENEIVAVGSSSETRAKSFAEENGIPKWHGSYEELSSDSSVQVVYVAGTTNAHAQASQLALKNGKHVLCEKAFAMNLRETKKVLELAKQKGLFLMEVSCDILKSSESVRSS